MDNLKQSIMERIEHMKEIDTSIDEISRAIEQLQEEKKAATTLKNNLRMEIREDMLKEQVPQVKIDGYADVSLKKGKDKLAITEPEKLPDTYIAKVDIKYDKKAIEKALKAGVPVKGAELVATDSILEIKMK
ncbi:MAG: siphovirus Gp157 family protein [Betaproteobacteria bacterium]